MTLLRLIVLSLSWTMQFIIVVIIRAESSLGSSTTLLYHSFHVKFTKLSQCFARACENWVGPLRTWTKEEVMSSL